jgi:hypothetical protein
MGQTDEGSMRHKILQSARNFKISWIDLGQSLYAAWKDKLYRDWGYATFEAYTAKEIGIKSSTAMKLLKSYYFLEKEEPVYLQKEQEAAPSKVASVPSYESVNLLRLASNKKALDADDYRALKKDVLEHGKDAGSVRKSLTTIMRQREELDPEEAREKKRSAVLKRFAATLKALKAEIEASKILPASMLKETSSLIAKIEAEIK